MIDYINLTQNRIDRQRFESYILQWKDGGKWDRYSDYIINYLLIIVFWKSKGVI